MVLEHCVSNVIAYDHMTQYNTLYWLRYIANFTRAARSWILAVILAICKYAIIFIIHHRSYVMQQIFKVYCYILQHVLILLYREYILFGLITVDFIWIDYEYTLEYTREIKMQYYQ